MAAVLEHKSTLLPLDIAINYDEGASKLAFSVEFHATADFVVPERVGIFTRAAEASSPRCPNREPRECRVRDEDGAEPRVSRLPIMGTPQHRVVVEEEAGTSMPARRGRWS